eukprot:CAMPEP_0177606224 /NCGR_PEP_ID=MMETSP0419_2-20121207/17181_1 /TAXON_ID=582737 /ORGANISM="Tetraselmis sp., Strain GSL018" /LENGTH=847 /DNA_ID=CAMNT_0019100547 /DNA_START=208 /DNA_END=2748 /DNA_ORIENTATION=-
MEFLTEYSPSVGANAGAEAEEYADFTQAQNLVLEAVKRAGSFFRSFQAAGQVEPEGRNTASSKDGLTGENHSCNEQDNRLPWLPRNPTEVAFSSQLQEEMLAISANPQVLLDGDTHGPDIDMDSDDAIETAAGQVLENDPGLRALRFRLVPRELSEDAFWARYFAECERIRRAVASRAGCAAEPRARGIGSIAQSPSSSPASSSASAGAAVPGPPGAAAVGSAAGSGSSRSLCGEAPTEGPPEGSEASPGEPMPSEAMEASDSLQEASSWYSCAAGLSSSAERSGALAVSGELSPCQASRHRTNGQQPGHEAEEGPPTVPGKSRRLRKMADTLAAARLMSLEEMARLSISPAAAHAEATGSWAGAILRAVGSSRRTPASEAVVASAEQVSAPRRMRLPGLRGLRGDSHSVDSPGADTWLASANDKVLAAVWELFDPMGTRDCASSRCLGSAGIGAGPATDQEAAAGLGARTEADIGAPLFEVEVGGAPPHSFLAIVARMMSDFPTVGQMAMFWGEIVDELLCHWSSSKAIPHVPRDQDPKAGTCLLHQRLWLLNAAILHRRARQSDLRNDPLPSRGGRPGGSVETPLQLASGEGLVWTPKLQVHATFAEDLCNQFPALKTCKQGPASTIRQALSDMSAFRAANPGAVPDDYEKWCAYVGRELPSALDGLLQGVPSAEFYPLRHLKPAESRASVFQLKDPQSWEDLFWSALPVSSSQQAPLFDTDAVGNAVMASIRGMVPSDVFEQLFLVTVVVEYNEAEQCPLAIRKQALQSALQEARHFAAMNCVRGMSDSKTMKICQVFEQLHELFGAVSREEKGDSSQRLDTVKSLSDFEPFVSLHDMEVDDEW